MTICVSVCLSVKGGGSYASMGSSMKLGMGSLSEEQEQVS